MPIAVWLSLIVFFLLPLLIAGLFALVRRKPVPWGEALTSGAISVAITAAIALAMGWTGISDSFYYRPSQTDFGGLDTLEARVDHRFSSQDGTGLHGVWLPSLADTVRGTVVHFHGSDSNISSTTRYVHFVRERGYNLFAFDYRGYGRSGGSPDRKGVVEDARAGLAYATAQFGAEGPMFLWGTSMGGQLAIVAVADQSAAAGDSAAAQAVAGIIAEATYDSYANHIAFKMSTFGPAWVVQWALWLGTSNAYSAIDRVPELDVPLLLVHGDADRVTDPAASKRLKNAAGDNATIWNGPGAGHLRVFRNPANRDLLVDWLGEAG